MKRRTVLVPTLAAVVASVVTTLTITSIAPASGARSTIAGQSIPLVFKIQFHTFVDPTEYTVAPGDVSKEHYFCPEGWHAVSGGYILGGSNGLSDATVTADYPGTSTTDWWVSIANPKLAASDITYKLDQECMEVDLRPINVSG